MTCSAIVNRRSTFILCSQAWVFSGSIKENILFGLPLDEERYSTALRVCALGPDLATLPSGDETEIGERGLNLSGGQKARVQVRYKCCTLDAITYLHVGASLTYLSVQLARAVYADREILVADDPLSAVDVHVGRHLWSECIVGHFVGRGRTVIIATHQLQYLSECSRIIVMEQGCIAHLGTYNELTARGVDLQNVVRDQGSDEPDDVLSPESADIIGAIAKSPATEQREREAESTLSVVSNPKPSSIGALVSQGGNSSLSSSTTKLKVASSLVVAEDRKVGGVTWSTLFGYFSYAGGVSAMMAIALLLFSSAASRQVGNMFYTALPVLLC